jgi:hypothetical protein
MTEVDFLQSFKQELFFICQERAGVELNLWGIDPEQADDWKVCG